MDGTLKSRQLQDQIQQLITNMATLAVPTRIGALNNTGSSGSNPYTQQLEIYAFKTTDSTPLYMHFKTNISSTANKIITLEAVGYNYGQALPIRCSWSFYTAGGTLYDRGRVNKASGLSADGMYLSSDGYVVIRAYSGSHYFTGWTFNAYINAWYYTDNIQITAAIQTSTSGNYY